jgi:hypothetical protein
MATAETETSQEERGAQGGLVYDGFISYSHAADDLLAPRLQAGLQRFAKPWWKRRALRIFRDESSLSANPHLWSSITDALDRSGWFVLLLSREAAASSWVNDEVEYWLEHKDADRIIPILTDGEFGWADGDFISDAAPPALRGAFSDEPRWVDLRFAATEEQLDLQNPRFSAAVADVASAIRGVPKDELESEEVRQHRRTVRTAWGAGIALLILVVLASATAVYAIGQQNRANDLAQSEAAARQDAVAAAEAEAAARDLADANAAEATAFARQVLLNSGRQQSLASPSGANFARADQRNIPLPIAEQPPGTTRLAFLEIGTTTIGCPLEDAAALAFCVGSTFFLHPTEPLIAGSLLAHEPFHIRHGFPNPGEEPLGSAFPPDFELLVYVTKVAGPPLQDGFFELGTSYRYTPDYLVRVQSERCGPGFVDQTAPMPCDEFVHEFADGLPPGSYHFWVEWRAPCSYWTTSDVCGGDDAPISLFADGAEAVGFYADSFTPIDHYPDGAGTWPFDPWERPPANR